jgi:ATP-dependent exoDNAse (exonuclease V) beta subunit
VIQKIKSLVSKNKDIRYKDITILLRSFKNTSFFKKFKFLN